MVTKRLVMAFGISVAVVGSLFLANQFSIQSQIRPTPVPVAAQDIPPHTEISEEMIKLVELPAKGIPPEALRTPNEVIGKWSQIDYGIPKNSFFYKGKVVTQEELLDAERMKLKDGERLYTLVVDIEKSAAGNVVPGVLVDIWYVGRGNDNKQVVGRLYRDILVVGAKNRKAEDIVNTDANAEEAKKQQTAEKYPTIVQLAVKDEQIPYLDLAQATGEIRLVPKSGAIVALGREVMPEEAEEDDFDVKEYLESVSIIPGKSGTAKTGESKEGTVVE